MKNRLRINFPYFLLLFLLLTAALIYTHSATPYNLVMAAISLLSFYIAGAAILFWARVDDMVMPVTHAVLSVLMGGLLWSVLIFLTDNPAVLAGAMIAGSALLLLLHRKSLGPSWQLEARSLWGFATALAIFALISTLDFTNQFASEIPEKGMPYTDPYFYTAIVSSLRHGSIHNAVWEQNTPINYVQLLSFFIPALLANVLKITSFQALWGFAHPLYKLLAILLCYDVFYYFVRDKVSPRNVFFVFLSLGLPILLSPLNPAHVLRGRLDDFMYPSITYMLPNGAFGYRTGPINWPILSVPWPLGVAMTLFSILLFAQTDWKSRRISGDKILFTVSLSLIAISKASLYPGVALFFGAAVLKRIIFNKERWGQYFGYMAASVVLAVIWLKIFSDPSSVFHTYFKYDHFKYTFMYQPFVVGYNNTNGVFHLIIYFCVLILSYLVWTSIRLIGLFGIAKKKAGTLNDFLFGAIVSIILTTTMALFLHIDCVDAHGKVLSDGSFDMEQYLKGSYYIVMIVAIAGMIYLFYNNTWRPGLRYAVFSLTGVWCAATLYFLVYYFVGQANTRVFSYGQNEWYHENVNELKTGRYDDGLIMVNPNEMLFGIMLCSSDYGRYWSVMSRSHTNYNSSIKNEYRWDLVSSLLDHPDTACLGQMHREGVKYIVATPADSAQFTAISTQYPGQLQKINGTRYFYRLQ